MAFRDLLSDGLTFRLKKKNTVTEFTPDYIQPTETAQMCMVFERA